MKCRLEIDECLSTWGSGNPLAVREFELPDCIAATIKTIDIPSPPGVNSLVASGKHNQRLRVLVQFTTYCIDTETLVIICQPCNCTLSDQRFDIERVSRDADEGAEPVELVLRRFGFTVRKPGQLAKREVGK